MRRALRNARLQPNRASESLDGALQGPSIYRAFRKRIPANSEARSRLANCDFSMVFGGIQTPLRLSIGPNIQKFPLRGRFTGNSWSRRVRSQLRRAPGVSSLAYDLADEPGRHVAGSRVPNENFDRFSSDIETVWRDRVVHLVHRSICKRASFLDSSFHTRRRGGGGVI